MDDANGLGLRIDDSQVVATEANDGDVGARVAQGASRDGSLGRGFSCGHLGAPTVGNEDERQSAYRGFREGKDVRGQNSEFRAQKRPQGAFSWLPVGLSEL